MEKAQITAGIIQDSVNPFTGTRITTFELEYPRFIHSEFMTHRVFSRNSASSRAIPVSKMLDQVNSHPAMPIKWGKNQAGMQAFEELDVPVYVSGMDHAISKEEVWRMASMSAMRRAAELADAGYHKQIVNRLVEPFQRMKVVVTATEWNNFFWLRNHKDAQPEIHERAQQMHELYTCCDPYILKDGELHVPYVTRWRNPDDGKLRYYSDENDLARLTEDEALMLSASLCAQVSYRKADFTLDKAKDIYTRLIESEPCHASPVEHQALCFVPSNCTWYGETWPAGVTHIDRNMDLWSGNFRGWIQTRQLIPNNAKYG